VPWKQLSGQEKPPAGSGSAAMRGQVAAARQRQAARQGAGLPNARLPGRKLDVLAVLDDASRTMLGQAMTELGLSARAYDKIRRVARTIADVEGSERVTESHVAEAVGYRLLDRRV
jgi:magnesium chelatase family protein